MKEPLELDDISSIASLVDIGVVLSPLFASKRSPLQFGPDVGLKTPLRLSLLNANSGKMDGFKVFEMFPQSEEENVKYGVLIAHVPPRKKLGAVKQERGEKFQFKGRLLKVCPRMKLRDNRRFRVFLQIHFKLVYHMIFFDLETEGSLRRGGGMVEAEG